MKVFAGMLLMAVAGCGWGQDKASKAGGSGGTADVPAANPARPTVTNPAQLPPVGYIQFEQGVVEADGSPGLDRQFSIVQVTKLAVTHRLMVSVGSQPIAYTADGGGTSSNDTGDLVLGGQVVLIDKDETKTKVPSVAVAYYGRVRSGSSADLDIGSFGRGITVFLGSSLFGLHYDLNYFVTQQNGSNAGGGQVRRAQQGQTISVSRPLKGKTGVQGELWHATQPLVFADRAGLPSARSNAVGLLFATTYTPRPNLVFDAGFEHGLTSTSTAWQGFVGVTYLLPHRLWEGGRR